MKETQISPEMTLAGFLHQHRESLVKETLRAFFEASNEEVPAGLTERKLENFLRDKLAAIEFYLASGALEHIRAHIRKSLQRLSFRSLGLSDRLRINLLMKRIVLDRLNQSYENQLQELAPMRLVLGRSVDEMLLEVERSWRRRSPEDRGEEPIIDAFFEATRGLASEHEFLNTLIDQSPQAIVTLDKDRRVLTWNHAAEAITGYSSKEALGQGFVKLLSSPKALGSLFTSVKTSGPIYNREVGVFRKGGEALPISFSIATLLPRKDLPAHYLCIFGDLTEQVRAREKALAVEKLAALASLSAAIAHEIRNPLNTLSLTVDVLEEVLRKVEGTPMEEVSPRLAVLREEIDQMSEITRTYLAVGRLPAPHLELKDLTYVLTSFTVQMAPGLKGLGITLEEDFQPDLPQVELDERQFRRALHNLFRNACEAMPQGGRLHLSTRVEEGFVKVRLSDSGPGVSKEALEDLFSPFHTTKEGGTGLGLYLVQEIMRAHRGGVAVENLPRRGAAVTLSVPLD